MLLQQISPPNTRYYALLQEDSVKSFGVLCVATNDSPPYYALVQEDIVKRVRRVSCSMALDQHKGQSFVVDWGSNRAHKHWP